MLDSFIVFLQKLKAKIQQFIDDLLEEFAPWLKWIILDAIFTLVVTALANRVSFLQPYFEIVGWV